MSEITASLFRLAIHDIANGDGICTATLRSGVQLVGRVKTSLTNQDVLHLSTTTGGWHTIAWEDVAAISGEPTR